MLGRPGPVDVYLKPRQILRKTTVGRVLGAEKVGPVDPYWQPKLAQKKTERAEACQELNQIPAEIQPVDVYWKQE